MKRILALLLAVGASACSDSLPGNLARVSNREATISAADSLPAAGPEILHAAPPRAPQLENTGIWQAEPILISGATAYRAGEFLYQDFLYDDYGAGLAAQADPNDAQFTSFLFSPKAGALRYPQDAAYANNAADLVELRLKPLAQATAFRVTLNSLIDPERVAFTLALGDGASARWPHGAGVSSPATYFLTVHGLSAELRDAASGAVVEPTPVVTVDLERRQFEVRVAHEAWNPGSSLVRIAAGVGLWDAQNGAYLAPSPLFPSATDAGGGAASGAALFNLAFRSHEPMPDWQRIGLARTTADAAAAIQVVELAWWRESAQAQALALGVVDDFYAEVDFAKLLAAQNDESDVPSHGPMSRIFASHHAFGQGADFTQKCDRRSMPPCTGAFIGQLQPYALYVPDRAEPAAGWGMTLLLHALSGNYNLFLNSRYQSQLGERGTGSLVLTPFSRGPDGDYVDIAEADVFEAWADVARHYRLDPSWSTVTGYSMGGGGTCRLLSRWPDLFARGAAVAATCEGEHLQSLRNTPLMVWIGVADEGTTPDRRQATRDALDAWGYPYTYDEFLDSDHLTVATNDEYGPLVAFLGEQRIDPNPAHVSYVFEPQSDSPRARVVADHAYWISGLQLRDAAASATGSIDAHSQGFGQADAAPAAVQNNAQMLMGGNHGPVPYLRWLREPSAPIAAPVANRLQVVVRNLAYAAIDTQRARLDCQSAEVQIETDGPVSIELMPCQRILRGGGA